MVKIWINKQVKEELSEDFTDSLIFNILDKSNKSNVKTNVQDLWRRFGETSLVDINEDLLIIAISVFCADKRIPRAYFNDNWTRSISMNIPVIEVNKWNAVRDNLVRMLSFLTGDNWSISFRQTTNKYRCGKESKYKLISNKKFDGVSLFSGGLDSYCGALKLLSEKKNTCFVGFREYSLLSKRQQELFNALDNYYNDINKEILLFNVTPRRPINIPGQMAKYGTESTTRSRSLLFLAGALAVASIIGKETPVYIPENGFIGINVPLTDSRSGSCSTRTTHPYFMGLFNNLLKSIGINNKIINFYSSFTKGEIVEEFADVPVFKEHAKNTISCSHPCQSRYDRIVPPKNCGYCYPCLIRKAAMNRINYDEDSYYNPDYSLTKNFISMYDNPDGKASDLRAMLLSLNKFLENRGDQNYLNYILLKHGRLSKNELDSYRRVYIESMKEILAMIQVESQRNNGDLVEYLGIDEDKREVVKQ